MKKVLLAGPGTGKTTKIKSIVIEHGDSVQGLILSFTNATVRDLLKDLSEVGVSEKNCMTLHKLAVKYDPSPIKHVLVQEEIRQMGHMSKGVDLSFLDLCKFLDCVTFEHMIQNFVSFAKANPEYLREQLVDFEYLIVDEYQDFNPIEQQLIDILMTIINDVYILGDDDQCIYDFKDASVDKIVSLHRLAETGAEDFSTIDHEHKCYRCPDKIVHSAKQLIQNNKKRIEKNWDTVGNDGEIYYKQVETFHDVADYILEKLSELDGQKVLILSPVNFAIIPLVEKLNDIGIVFDNSFQKNISDEFLQFTWEVRSLFGDFRYFHLVMLGYRLLSIRKDFYALLKAHYDNGQNFQELYNFLEKKLPQEMLESYSNLDDLLNKERYAAVAVAYKEMPDSIKDERKLEAILRIFEKTEDCDLRVMSIHKSKGLSANHVFMVGLIEGILPNSKRGNDSMEAQRRLFYVGMTRARQSLHLISSYQIEGKHVNTVNKSDFTYNFRKKEYRGRASRFIEEVNLKSD